MNPRSLLLAAALAAWLAGCGPGTGGTGTGSSLAEFGATPANVCTAAFASSLRCAPELVTTPTPPDPDGTRPTGFVDRVANTTLTLGLEGNRVRLDARCAGLAFDGEWGRTGDGQLRYWGSVARAGVAAAGSLEVGLPDGSPVGLVVTLRDAGGQVLLGPIGVITGSPAANGPC